MPALFFFFNDTATTEIYTLSLHDALPIFHHGDLRLAREAARDVVRDESEGVEAGIDGVDARENRFGELDRRQLLAPDQGRALDGRAPDHVVRGHRHVITTAAFYHPPPGRRRDADAPRRRRAPGRRAGPPRLRPERARVVAGRAPEPRLRAAARRRLGLDRARRRRGGAVGRLRSPDARRPAPHPPGPARPGARGSHPSPCPAPAAARRRGGRDLPSA